VAGLAPEFAEGIWLNPAEVLLTRFVLFNQTIAIRRQVFEQAGLFDEKYRLLEDYDLALRLALTGPWAYTTEPLVVWHGGAQNSLSRRASEMEALAKTDEILSGLQNSTTWADKLPRMILQRHRKFIQRCRRLRQLAGSSNGLAAKVARIFLRLDKWIYQHRPSFPRMKIRSL
jgi:GT2 family glycosyltransferase